MLISYHGHAQFLLECQRGFSILTDPYDGHVGYPMKSVRADAVTVSHGHGDHNFVEKVAGTPAIVDSEGLWQVSPDVRITALPSFHDEVKGQKRGSNLIMKMEAEDLSIVHLGDLGVPPDEEQIRKIGKVDVLMLPVGGYYTMGPEDAKKTVELLHPRVVIPMHYKTEVNADWPIAGVEEFLSLMGEKGLESMPLIRITLGDLAQQPGIALLDWRKEA